MTDFTTFTNIKSKEVIKGSKPLLFNNASYTYRLTPYQEELLDLLGEGLAGKCLLVFVRRV